MSDTTDPAPRLCRMFPLGSVLVPGAPLPLHIFEPRYQQLLNETLEDDRTFAVTLIARGHEVGGGDARLRIGTRAHIDEYSRFDDGRAAVAARGLGRIEVIEWLEDDPYPKAMVVDRVTEPSPVAAHDLELVTTTMASFAALLDTAEALGQLRRRPDITLPDDPEEAAWALAAIAPISDLDRQGVLELDRVDARLRRLTEAFEAMAVDLRLMADLDDR